MLALTLPAFGGRGQSRAPAAGGQLNAWLKIAQDNSITVLVDRSEMGQGVYTSLPTLLAEELEIDLARISVIAAPVGDAYINALNGGQITGTSNSVQDAWEKLRIAGAQARSMLIAAAAKAWRVDPAECRATNGVVTNARGKTFTYGELAEDAAMPTVNVSCATYSPHGPSRDSPVTCRPTDSWCAYASAASATTAASRAIVSSFSTRAVLMVDHTR